MFNVYADLRPFHWKYMIAFFDETILKFTLTGVAICIVFRIQRYPRWSRSLSSGASRHGYDGLYFIAAKQFVTI
jgi:hypothetical protein